MATHAQLARAEPDDDPQPRLTDRLDEKLAELIGKGFEIVRIECCKADLTRLVTEDEAGAIRLDRDPVVDRAWYGELEIRYAPERELTWVFLKGEAGGGEISVHIVSLPDPESEPMPAEPDVAVRDISPLAVGPAAT